MLTPRYITKAEREARMGLGDAVAMVAEPIRNALGIKPCSGCAKRKAALNKLLPNVNPLVKSSKN